MLIRKLEDADHPALLRVNAAIAPAVARLDPVELRRLAAIGSSHLVAIDADAHCHADGGTHAGGAAEVLGYLLAFEDGDAYDGEEFLYFAANLRRSFLYIDQIAIGGSRRRSGVGRALYESAFGRARVRGLDLACCEINLDPPNPDSMAFHLRIGFGQIAAVSTRDGRDVALMTRVTADFSAPR